jgi:hypothetical protein
MLRVFLLVVVIKKLTAANPLTMVKFPVRGALFISLDSTPDIVYGITVPLGVS